MDQDNNIWEQLETHMHDNLGTYGLKMMDAFLDLKEQAEDCGMCPPDTPERQQRFEQQHGEAHAPGSRPVAKWPPVAGPSDHPCPR